MALTIPQLDEGLHQRYSEHDATWTNRWGSSGTTLLGVSGLPIDVGFFYNPPSQRGVYAVRMIPEGAPTVFRSLHLLHRPDGAVKQELDEEEYLEINAVCHNMGELCLGATGLHDVIVRNLTGAAVLTRSAGQLLSNFEYTSRYDEETQQARGCSSADLLAEFGADMRLRHAATAVVDIVDPVFLEWCESLEVPSEPRVGA